MSDPLRIGFVVEGPTDFVVLESVVARLLDGREFEPVAVQPLLSSAFGATTGGGWTSIYLWCRQIVDQAGGAARANPLFGFHDLVVMQIDADVAGKAYTDDARIQDPPNDLPFSRTCPPARDTTDRLREIVLGWLDEDSLPPQMVLCTPSKSLETWILVALFPKNKIAAAANVECRLHPENQLETRPLAQRLIRSGKKDIAKYRHISPDIAAEWANVRQRCTEAERFTQEFATAVSAT
jgi:hypothetical protein